MSTFKDLISETFPTIRSEPGDSECVVARHFHHDRAELSPLSDAVAVVDECGQRPALVAKLRREHPLSVAHQAQFDERALDVMTESCALAWASNIACLGTPAFTTATGAPDLRTDSGWWVEAKALHPSDDDKALMKWLLESGQVVSGAVTGPGPGLLRKARSSLLDAARKFERQNAGRFAVFVNLTGVDVGQVAIRASVLTDLLEALTPLAAERRIERIALCYGYLWSAAIMH